MSNFKREERYIVVKVKTLSDSALFDLRDYLYQEGIQTTDCVVVESDWPEYEIVWKMIEERVNK